MIASRTSKILPLLNPYTMTAMGAVFLALVYFTLNLDTDKTGFSYLYVLMVLQLTPFLVAVTRKYYNYISFVLFNHFISYSLNKYNELKSLQGLSAVPQYTLAATKELILCTIIMMASYFASRTLFFHDFVHRQKYQALLATPFQVFLLGCYVMGVPIYLQFIPAQILIIHFTLLAADILLLMCIESPGYERFAKLVRLGALSSCILYFLDTGFLSMVGQYAAFRFITICLRQKYKEFILLAFLTVFVSAVQTVKADYRTFIRNSPPETTLLDKVAYLRDLLVIKYIAEEVETVYEEETLDTQQTLITGFSRVGDDSIERVMAWTPSRVPFWNGRTYATIPYMFIPRALWKNKPSRHFWNEFGRSYGYLSEDDNQTSVGVGYLAEAYMNFGFTGLYVCALFVGFLLALTERISYFVLRGYYYFTYIFFLIPLVNFGNDMGTMLNSLVICFCSIFAVRTILLRMSRRDDYS